MTRPDLRALALAAMAWAGGLAGLLLPAGVVLVALAAAGLLVVVRHRRVRGSTAAPAWWAAAAAVAVSAVLRADAVAASPLAALAEDGAFVVAEVRVTSDPLPRTGAYGPYVLVRATTRTVVGRGRRVEGHIPVLLIADERWSDVELGSLVRVAGRAGPAAGDDLGAVIATSRPPEVVDHAGVALDAAAAVRAAIRRSVAGAGEAERSLVPALVVGDDAGMPDGLADDFRASGLTHLLAVSGTNLTLVVGFVLVLARWGGVRARGLVVVGLLGVAGFVLLARTEPSVVRAATMGTVALVGMGSNGRERGPRALGVAVLVLLLLDPRMATSVGFALSVVATAGILFLAPPWRDALCRWTPRWLAEAISVPLAAQLACTPVVAGISDQVSLVAVVANILVAPAVGPATVLGLAGGLLGLASGAAGAVVGRAAAWCAWWITVVADRSADLPTATVGWSASLVSIGGLTLLCVAVATVMPRVLARPWPAAAAGLVMVASFAVPLPTPGWPPKDWVMVACDVGQGDGLVLNAGEGRAVVVDVGPEGEGLDRCLHRLDVEALPAVVLTHFHEDHVAGLDAVLAEYHPAELQVTALSDPSTNAAEVAEAARAAGVPVRVPVLGEVRRCGLLSWQVVGPEGRFATGEAPTEGSAANNASVALLVQSRGVRLLLTGDMEPEAQEAMSRSMPGLRADVLKVPHHGSRYQDPRFLTGVGAVVALISVGEDNTYGHPSSATVRLLEETGALVRRTDESGDVAVVVRDGLPGVVVRRPAS